MSDQEEIAPAMPSAIFPFYIDAMRDVAVFEISLSVVDLFQKVIGDGAVVNGVNAIFERYEKEYGHG